MALLAILSHLKLTFLCLAVLVWGLVMLTPGLGWRRRALVAGGFPLAWILSWLLAGQSLGNIPAFLIASLEIVRCYSASVGTPGDPRTVYGALGALSLFFVLVLSYPLSVLRRRENLMGLALLGATLFLVWKNGFVRQDFIHMSRFFSYLLLAPFAVAGLLGEAMPPSRLRAGLASAMVLFGILGHGAIPRPTDLLRRLYFDSVVVLTPGQFKRSQDKDRESLAQTFALPNIRRRVGDAPTDLITDIQSVLLLNQLNYRPRPIFHGYSAYTPNLAERNAAFYRSEQAPSFVISFLAPLDGHFPAMEDGPALLELFRRYRLVNRERDFLLFERLANPRPTETIAHPILLHRTIAFDEEVQVGQLGGMPKLLSVRIQDSLIGRLRTGLFRPVIIELRLHTQDGKTYTYRLIPGMASSGFLLDPLLRDQADIEALYTGQALPPVRSFSIHVDPDARMFFQERMETTLRSAEELTSVIRTRD